MTSQSNSQRSEPIPGADTQPPIVAGATRSNAGGVTGADAGSGGEPRYRSANEKAADPADHTGGKWRGPPQLGALEYMLVALIVVCVAITIVMAIVNPGG